MIPARDKFIFDIDLMYICMCIAGKGSRMIILLEETNTALLTISFYDPYFFPIYRVSIVVQNSLNSILKVIMRKKPYLVNERVDESECNVLFLN